VSRSNVEKKQHICIFGCEKEALEQKYDFLQLKKA
jgi:hypothetical protein